MDKSIPEGYGVCCKLYTACCTTLDHLARWAGGIYCDYYTYKDYYVYYDYYDWYDYYDYYDYFCYFCC